MIFLFHKKIRVIFFHSIFLMGLFCPGLLWARSTPNIPPSSPIYLYIDKLIAYRLVDNVIYGQRPWSRDEVARIVAISMMNYEMQCVDKEKHQRNCSFIKKILEYFKEEFKEELIFLGVTQGKRRNIVLNSLDQAIFRFDFLESPYRTIPMNSNLGDIDAQINSFAAYQEGRHLVDGFNFALETTHSALLSKWTSLYFHPRFELLIDNSDDIEANPIVHSLYGKLNLGNFEIEIGRDSVIWGQSPEGGVLASSNVRPYDMIKISNDHPFRLPWYLKYLGYHKYTLLLAHLGPEYNLKNALMLDFAASLKPFYFLEVGFEHQMILEGEGSPDYGFYDFLKEFFLYRDFINRTRHGDNFFAHRFGLNLRLHIPQLRNTVLYAEGIFEDYGRHSYWLQYKQQLGFQGGIYIPLLTSDGKNDLRLQFEHIPPAYGRHGIWPSGHTLNQLSMGTHWGPQSLTLSAEWNHWIDLQKKLNTQLMYINSGGDTFTDGPGRGLDEYIKVQDNSNEYRFLVLASYQSPLRHSFLIQPQVGYEYVANYNFQDNENRHNFYVGFQLVYDR